MSPDLSNNGSLNHRYLIKNAYAILTGGRVKLEVRHKPPN